ncbi:amidohydrolase, partial [Anaerolineae bacterium CFX8]|nr:amidohydrolase [Anaerolineae bacterium CFX8]
MIDRILYNGNIITLNGRQPRVSALAISGERIAAYGSDDDVKPLALSGAKLENLNGRTVIPGLVDAHIHWQGTARAMHEVNVFEVPDRQTAAARVAERAHH